MGLFAYHGPVARDWLFYNLQPARTASESRATARDWLQINQRARPLRVSWAYGP
jgi:hypothetical protein